SLELLSASHLTRSLTPLRTPPPHIITPLARTSFLQTPCTPRHLHSFPTRRSSDLAPDGVTSISCSQTWYPVRSSLTVCLRLVSRDRKSTRLNSSHQITSYAVFCLKKKMTY